MATKIILSRKNEFSNRSRFYKIFINGTEAGRVTNGGSEEFQIQPGVHTVQCKVNWCSSPELTVEVKEGETRFLKAYSALKYYPVGYVLLILSLISPALMRFAKIPVPAFFSTIQLTVLIPFLLYIIYYLTIGKKKYIVLEEDKANIFN